jgi:hypothetical protein
MCFWNNQPIPPDDVEDTTIPGPLTLPPGALVLVENNGKLTTGINQGPSESGEYKVRLDIDGSTRSFKRIRLPN